MRKRRIQNSLELFLDTICNMFGGFVFIMLFVVVSIRSTTSAQLQELQASGIKPVPDVDVAILRNDLEKLQHDYERLVQDREDAKEYILTLIEPDVVELYKETLGLLEQLEKTQQENQTIQNQNNEKQRNYEQIALENKKLQTSLTQVRQEVKSIEEEALAQKKKRVRKTTAPKYRFTFKDEIPVIVKYGRVYFWHKYGTNGSRISDFNDDEFLIVKTKLGAVETQPKPWKGVDLNAEDVETALSNAFRPFNKNTHYFSIVVAHDSFAEYNILSSYLKRKGYEINPVVLKKGEGVVDRGGYGGSAQ